MNEGKKFEQAWKLSIPPLTYFQRIRDPAQSFNQSDTLRFSLQNPYDCFMFQYPVLFTLELKSTEGSSMTFYRDDFVNDGKKHTFMVKKNQIVGLQESNKYKGIISGFLFNWRKTNHTYFLSVDKFLEMTNQMDKKSFNETDVINANAYLIEQELKRTNYKYNIQKFIDKFKENFTYDN